MYKLCFYVPVSHVEQVKEAVFAAGAGSVGDYRRCCWQVLGQGQFEQQLNAHMLKVMGYGAEGTQADESALATFLYRLAEYEQALQHYLREGNHKITAKLDELLANGMQKLLAFRR